MVALYWILMKKQLAIVVSHPIQYYVPIYRRLAAQLNGAVKVYFGRTPTAEEQGSTYGVSYKWDVDLSNGYEHESDQRARDEFTRMVREKRFDAVLLHGWADPFSRFAIRQCRRFGVPLLLRCDNHLRTPQNPAKRLLKNWIQPRLLKQFARCLAVGTWNREYYEYYGVPKSRIGTSPHCVDVTYFREKAKFLQAKRDEIRSQWGAGKSEFICLFVGRLCPLKRVDDLIRAIATPCHPGKVSLWIVGDGQHRRTLEELVGKLKVRALFLGFKNQSELASFYTAADLLVLPSDRETWGLVVNEALACGRPCVVSDHVGCHVDLIFEGITGSVFPCGNLSELGRSVEKWRSEIARNNPWDSKIWQDVVLNHTPEAAAKGVVMALEEMGISL
jgi:glycosyltransferase involved in cell wall biosynthesis